MTDNGYLCAYFSTIYTPKISEGLNLYVEKKLKSETKEL